MNITQDNIRVQLLSTNIVRVEYSPNGVFFDGESYFVPKRFPAADVRCFVQHNFKNINIMFDEYSLIVPKNASGISGVALFRNGIKICSCSPLVNSGELPDLAETPEAFAVADNPRLTVAKDGSLSSPQEVEDIYILICKKDFKLLRKLFVAVFGQSELVRLSTLGYWNSKYYAYTQEEAQQTILEHKLHGVPLDVFVVDTDWRKNKNGVGYEVNDELFSDMRAFLRFAHQHNVEVALNDHPELCRGAKSCIDPVEMDYRRQKLTELLEMGADYLWYDRNWKNGLVSPTDKIHAESLGMYIYRLATAQKNAADSQSKRIFRRPVIMGNVDNIRNGEYVAINDSADHRFSVQWTGDTNSGYTDLYREITNMVRTGNNCVAYVSSDCGGHMGNPTKEEFVRWNQFCALSPIYRPHCTKNVERTREPWQYDAETEEIVKNYINMRYNLLPIIYKNAFVNYLSGIPIFKSLAFCYPEDKRAQKIYDQYMLGNNLLIAPYCGGVTAENNAAPDIAHAEIGIYLPAGEWLDVFDGHIYKGGRTIHKKAPALSAMPLFVRVGAVLPLAKALNTKLQRWNKLTYDIYPSKTSFDIGYLYEDDATTTAYREGQFRICKFSTAFERNSYLLMLKKSEGDFKGTRNYAEREVTLKYHMLKGMDEVEEVLINGESVPFRTYFRRKASFPLNDSPRDRNHRTLAVSFCLEVGRNYQIEFRLK